MHKKLAYIIIFLIVAFFQLSFLPIVSPQGVAIDAVLMAILAWSVIDGYYSFFNWAIFFGFLYDLVSYSFFGTHALIFLLVMYSVSFFSRRVSIDFKGIGIIIFLFSILLATFLSNLVTAGISAWKYETLHGFWQSFGGFKASMIGLMFNTFLFFIFFSSIKKIKRFFAIEY